MTRPPRLLSTPRSLQKRAAEITPLRKRSSSNQSVTDCSRSPQHRNVRSCQIRARPLEQKQIQEEDLKPEFRLKVAEWELRKALAGPSANKVQVADIQKLMPDDFNRKLKEWELMKISSPSNER